MAGIGSNGSVEEGVNASLLIDEERGSDGVARLAVLCSSFEKVELPSLDVDAVATLTESPPLEGLTVAEDTILPHSLLER